MDAASCQPMHLQALRTRAGDTPAAILFQIGNSLEVMQVAPKKLRLVIPKPAPSARSLFAASSEAADSSRDNAALRNNSLGSFQITPHYEQFRECFTSSGNRLQ